MRPREKDAALRTLPLQHQRSGPWAVFFFSRNHLGSSAFDSLRPRMVPSSLPGPAPRLAQRLATHLGRKHVTCLPPRHPEAPLPLLASPPPSPSEQKRFVSLACAVLLGRGWGPDPCRLARRSRRSPINWIDTPARLGRCWAHAAQRRSCRSQRFGPSRLRPPAKAETLGRRHPRHACHNAIGDDSSLTGSTLCQRLVSSRQRRVNERSKSLGLGWGTAHRQQRGERGAWRLNVPVLCSRPSRNINGLGFLRRLGARVARRAVHGPSSFATSAARIGAPISRNSHKPLEKLSLAGHIVAAQPSRRGALEVEERLIALPRPSSRAGGCFGDRGLRSRSSP